MTLRGGLLGGLATRQFERRQRFLKLRVSEAHVRLYLDQQRLLVLGPQDLPAPALHDGCHPAVKTV